MKRNETLWRPCANDNCPRPASAGEALCETCALERSLYRRAERAGLERARDRFPAVPGDPPLGTIVGRPD